MNKLKIALRSRTTWTIVIIFIINGLAGIRDLIPPELLTLADAILSFAAIYFRIARKADL